MSDIFKLVLSMSLSGSVLTLLLLLLKPLFKENFSKAWQYYIWIVVLLRLLVPFTPEFGLTNDLFHSKTVHITMLPQADTEAASDAGDPTSAKYIIKPQSNQDSAASSITTEKDNTTIPDIWEIAGLVWFIGAILLLAFKLVQYLQFTYSVRSGAEPVADQRIIKLYLKTLKELGIKKGPRLFYSCRAASPMLIGLTKPSVYLTGKAMQMEDRNLTYVLRHELMHYKRHDLWYKWCCDLTMTIHWFNPFVYLMGRQINSQCEISCDEALTTDLTHEEKLIYGNMLLNAASDNISYHNQVLSTTLYEDKKSLKERILSIMTSKRKSKRVIVVSIIAAILLCTAAFLLGAYTAGNSTEAKGNIAETTENDSDIADNTNITGNTDTEAESTDTAAGNTNTVTDNAGEVSDNSETSADSSDQTPTDTDVSSDTADNSDEGNSITGTDTISDNAAENIVYKDDKYGFEITLPASWKGFTTQQEDWQGIAVVGEHQGEVVEAGTKLIIRHPEWTDDNPRQDIPIMVFTLDQWKLIENEEIAVSAAPIGPTKLSSNSDYVFALPARYNYAFRTGFEEVEQIIKDNFDK